MLKKIILFSSICFLLISQNAVAKDMINATGVQAVKDVVDKTWRGYLKKSPETGLKSKESNAASAIEAVGKAEASSTVFGMVNRPLNDKEKESYPDIKSFLFAKDGVAVIVHPDNPIQSITSSQLKDILQGKITNWSQLGGNKGVISMLIREKAANQRAAFEKLVLGKDKMAIGKAREISSMGDVKTEVAMDKSAMGYVLISSLDKKVKPIELDKVAPSIANVKAGTYPITIPYYLITKGEPSGAVKNFFDYFFSPEGQVAIEKEKIAFTKK